MPVSFSVIVLEMCSFAVSDSKYVGLQSIELSS